MIEELWVRNPDLEDFTIQYALHDEGPKSYTIKGMSIAKFPAPVAEHMKKHLADMLYNKRGLKNYAKEIPKIMLELERKSDAA